MGRREVGAVLAALACVVGTARVFADAGPGAASGTWSAYVGPASSSTNLSYGSAVWNANVSPRTVALTAYGTAMASGKCETTYFDWGTTNGNHFDARAVRTCKNGSTMSHTWADSYSAVGGVQKLGVCYAQNNTQSTGGSCTQFPGRTDSIDSIPKSWGAMPQNDSCSISWYRRNSNGTVSSWASSPSTSGTIPCAA